MKRITFLVILAILSTQAKGSTIFSDDFEDGTLNKWTIDGRQQGINTAEVVNRNNSQMAHLHHKGYTEITIEKQFDYNSNLIFNFDMEASASSCFGPTSDHYAMGGAYFRFLDSSEERIGNVAFVNSTSSYVFDEYNPRPDWYFVEVEDDSLHSYTLNVSNVLSYLDIDKNDVTYVTFYFRAYGSGLQTCLMADVWADNVIVVPEPATILLLGLGGLLLRKRKA